MNTYTNEREWAVDATPYDAKASAEIKRLGLNKKLKTPKENDHRKEDFLTFRRKEFRTDKAGNKVKNDPIKVTHSDGSSWGNDLLGNGTIADVKFNYVKYGPGKPEGVYIQAIRVLKLVPYEVQEFEPLGEDDEFFAGDTEPKKGTKKPVYTDETGLEDEDLNDEVPF